MDNTMKSVAFHNLGCKVNGNKIYRKEVILLYLLIQKQIFTSLIPAL